MSKFIYKVCCRLHTQGGEHYVLRDNDHSKWGHAELEESEYVIRKEVHNKKIKVDNETANEVLTRLIKEYGNCDKSEDDIYSGDVIICRNAILNDKKYTFEGTLYEFMNKIQGEAGCKLLTDVKPQMTEKGFFRTGGCACEGERYDDGGDVYQIHHLRGYKYPKEPMACPVKKFEGGGQPISKALGGRLEHDFSGIKNIKAFGALLALYNSFITAIGHYLCIGKEDYVIDRDSQKFIFVRKKELGDFTEVEKVKIHYFFNPYLDASLKPDIAKFIHKITIDKNFIIIHLQSVYLDGGQPEDEGLKQLKEKGQDMSGQNMTTNEILNEFIFHPDLDASIYIQEIDPQRDKMEHEQGYKYKAKISYPESLGEQGNYEEGFVYKAYPTNEEQKQDIIDTLKKNREQIIEGGKKAFGLEEIYSGRDEEILKAINKVLDVPKEISNALLQIYFSNNKPINIADLNKKIITAIQENPQRITHGHTAKNAFYISDDIIAPHNEYKKIEKKDYIFSVHSHLPENYQEHPNEIYDTFSGGDIYNIKWYMVNWKKFLPHIVLTSTKTYDLIGLPQNPNSKKLSEFIKLGEKRIMDYIHLPYDVRLGMKEDDKEIHRKQVRIFTDEFGLMFVENIVINDIYVAYKTIIDGDGTKWEAVSTLRVGKSYFDIYRNGIRQEIGAYRKIDIEPAIDLLRESIKEVSAKIDISDPVYNFSTLSIEELEELKEKTHDFGKMAAIKKELDNRKKSSQHWLIKEKLNLFTDLLTTKPGIKEKAGVVIFYKDKILLTHPTGAGWQGTYSIPKGVMMQGETAIQAAERELREETGIQLPEKVVKQFSESQADIIMKYREGGIVQYPEMINGFYSPIEKNLLETKVENKSSTAWLQQLGKGDEMIFTGLKAFLENKKPNEQVNKSEIFDYLKNNRIEIVEVVKGAEREELEKSTPKGKFVVTHRKEGYYEKPIAGFETEKEAFAFLHKQKLGANESINVISREEYISDALENEHPTKFSQYQLEGEKSDYKEVLITMPAKTKYGKEVSASKRAAMILQGEASIMTAKNEPVFRSPHFDEPNIISHLRMNNRTDAEGKKILFLEEIQSDANQIARKKGIKENIEPPKLISPQDDVQLSESQYQWAIKGEEKKYYVGKGTVGNAASAKEYLANLKNKELQEEYLKKLRANEEKVPDLPYIKDTNATTKLALKFALQYATKGGLKKISWTTGEQQNDRYDLSKQVKAIHWSENGKKKYVTLEGLKGISDQNLEIGVDKESGRVVVMDLGAPREWQDAKLDQVVGKEIAQKILNEENGKLEGEGLKIGGKGMIGFYGSPKEGKLGIVGQVAESLFGKGSVKTTELPIGTAMAKADATLRYSRGEITLQELGKLQKQHEQSKSTQHSIDITPEIIDKVKFGLPLFREGGQVDDKPIFQFMKDSPMHQARAIAALIKKIKIDDKTIMPIHEWIESMESGLEVKTSKLHSGKSEKGYVEKPTIGNYIVFSKAEQDYYKYLQAGGESYTDYLKKKKDYDNKIAIQRGIEKEIKDKEFEKTRVVLAEQAKQAKNNFIKELIERGKEPVMAKMIKPFQDKIDSLREKNQTQNIKEDIAYNERMIEQTKKQVENSYKKANILYEIKDGQVQKKYDWKAGDDVSVEGFIDHKPAKIETKIESFKENLDNTITYKVENKEGIINPYLGYDSLLPVTVEYKIDANIQNIKPIPTDIYLTKGIKNISSDKAAMVLLENAFKRGMIPEYKYNEFGKRLSDIKGKHIIDDVAALILEYSEKKNVKDDEMIRQIQEEENQKFEQRQKELEKYIPSDELQAEKEYDEINRIMDKKNPTDKEVEYVNKNAFLPAGYEFSKNGLVKKENPTNEEVELMNKNILSEKQFKIDKFENKLNNFTIMLKEGKDILSPETEFTQEMVSDFIKQRDTIYTNDTILVKIIDKYKLKGKPNDIKRAFAIAFAQGELPSKLFNKTNLIDADWMDGDMELKIRPIEQKIKTLTSRTLTDKSLSLKDIVYSDKDLPRPQLEGVYHDAKNKVLVATNAYVLVKISDNRIKKTEVREVDNSGVFITMYDGKRQEPKFPNYEAVIEKDMPIKFKINIQEWLNITNGVARANKFFGTRSSGTPRILIKIIIGENENEQEFFFNPEYINRVLTVFSKHGLTAADIKLNKPNRAMHIKSGEIFGLVMPVQGGEYPYYLLYKQ